MPLWPVAYCWLVQVVFCMLLACASSLLPVTYMPRWYAACCHYTWVEYHLSPEHAGSLLPVTGMQQLKYSQ